MNWASGSERSSSATYAASISVLCWYAISRRLEVGALDEPHVEPERQQAVEVITGAAQVALQHDADVVAAALAQPPVQVERGVHDGALLHVDAQPHVALAGVVEQARDALEHQLVIEVHAEVRELETDVGGEPFVGQSRDLARVLAFVDGDLRRRQRIVVEEPGDGPGALGVELAENRDDLVEGLGRDELPRAEPHAVAGDQPVDPRALRCPQDGAARDLMPEGGSTRADAARESAVATHRIALRRSLPLLVRGSTSTKSTRRGYL